MIAALVPGRDKLPLLSTCLICVMLYAAVCFKYPDFFALQNTVDLLRNSEVLGIVAVGMTFVILAGGIDLSVGALVAFGTVVAASLVTTHHWHPFLAFTVAIAASVLLGLISGTLIQLFEIPAFLVTLGMMFFARGIALLISNADLSIDHPLYTSVYNIEHSLPKVAISTGSVVFILMIAIGAYITLLRPLGRYIFAVGGNEQSALLMGLPVARTRIFVYAFSGLCSGLAACVSTLHKPSGNPLDYGGMDPAASAAVVLGGTLPTGGRGTVFGTFVGVLIFAIIQSAISFASLDSQWNRITTGGLLLAFILLQRLLQPREASTV